ncbi:MAG: C1 family peptidase [Bacteroidota bacterium]
MQIKLVFILTPLLLLHCYVSSNFAQQDHLAEAMDRISWTNNIIKEKGYNWKAGLTSMSILPKSELEKRCGIIPDSTFNPLEQKQYGEKLYLEWKKSNDRKIQKTSSSINWRIWMSSIEDQGNCGNCWAHASTGVAEGLLHYLYGDNIDIDLNEMEITNHASCAYGCDGCTYENIDCGLSYIKNYEVESENHNQFPNRTKAFYSVATYSRQAESINAIQTALETSPVFATMSIFQDFVDYTGGIYEYTSGIYLGEHAIVIVDYGNDNGTDYWVCTNSWGYNWGDNVYFLIKFGECGIDSYGDLVKATVNSNSFGSFVPQFFNTINGAIQNSKSGEVTYISTGTFEENISNDKYDVGICGSGTNSTTINGTVTFSSADYSSLKNTAVNGKISVNNSSSVVIDNVKANNSNCYIDAYGSSVTAITLFVGVNFFLTNYRGV